MKIGTLDAQVMGAYLVAAGEYQVNLVVPQMADGEYPITVSSGGKTSPGDVLFEIGQ